MGFRVLWFWGFRIWDFGGLGLLDLGFRVAGVVLELPYGIYKRLFRVP